MEFVLDMPPSLSDQELQSVENHGVVVVVGANGSGKTRLGSWIEFESEHKENVHRVSAQRSLDIPESIRPDSISRSKKILLYGRDRGNLTYQLRRGSRWRSRPNTVLLNDYQQLLVFLFSEEFQQSVSYKREAQQKAHWIEPPVSKLDIIQAIWETLLPNRELEIGASEINVRHRGTDETYSGRDLSDGERVIFYLIGECLAAPEDAVIVIDEPEIHLHKSIQADLWDAIESQRSDCLFVYLTHDLDFATSRLGAPKVCLREFNGENWDWYLVPENVSLPKEIMLQIVGSRKPILFTEGEQGSLDSFIYGYLFPEFTLVPCGSCSHVIHATNTFAELDHLHRLECRGIVDRDFRTDEEIQYLQDRGIAVLDVSEIENLLLYEDILVLIASKLHFEDEDRIGIVENAKEIVFTRFEESKHRVASAITAGKIESSFRDFDPNAHDGQQLEEHWRAFTGSLDVQALYNEALEQIEEILDAENYLGALRFYDNKGLIYEVSRPLFGMSGNDLGAFQINKNQHETEWRKKEMS